MSEMAGFTDTSSRPICAAQGVLTGAEQRLIQRFRQMPVQEQHQVLRLLEVLSEHPTKPE